MGKNLRLSKKLLVLSIIVIVLIITINILRDKLINYNFYEIDVKVNINESNYAEVSSFEEFQNALETPSIEIIDLKNDLDLGYNNIKQNLRISFIEKHNEAITHPKLMEVGVSKIKILNRENLIIMSSNGSKLLHTNIIIQNSKNIKIQNIKMEELWEWDEEDKGEFDKNNWDYITIENSENICIQNCEFSKSYDGIIDINNSKNVTIKYCKLNEMDVNNDFYNQQFDYLEKNKNDYPMYKYLREEMQFSVEKIKELFSFQFKVFLVGKNEESFNENVIIHDCLFLNAKTRIPMLRNTTSYIYNIYVDSSKINFLQSEIKKHNNFKELKQKYHKVVSLDTYGVISICKSNAVVENYYTDGVKFPYRVWIEKEMLGRININKNTISKEELKSKLEKEAGVTEINDI